MFMLQEPASTDHDIQKGKKLIAWPTQPSHREYVWLFEERNTITSKHCQKLEKIINKNQQVKTATTKPPKNRTHLYFYLEMSVVFIQLPAHHQLPQASIQRQRPAPCYALVPPRESNIPSRNN